ncbi:MAG: DUF115 domain-containing protein [Spirochaetales bacterium]|jgi:hypothetical protein|nr:DUF115 domain-containing protein [Spirochaetales bacterium]
MIRFEKARNGSPIAVAGGRYLNSRYDPQSEAQKYVNDQIDDNDPALVVILGETNGYLSSAVNDLLPTCSVVTVCYDKVFAVQSCQADSACWNPLKSVSLPDFFAASISETKVASMMIIEWEPCAKAFPVIADKAIRAVRDITAMHNASIATSAAFGRLWIRNIVSNYLIIDSVAPLPYKNLPILITASGPTLADGIVEISRHREKVQLWALPSSLKALASENLIPDLIVITDPGYYSKLHLGGTANTSGRHVAMPYSAVKMPSMRQFKTILLNQGLALENTLLQISKIHHTVIQPNGTVAGTAYMLAASLGVPIIFAGLDFIGRDIFTHVRPHAFDSLLDADIHRTSSGFTGRYIRAFKHQLSHSAALETHPLGIYSTWFQKAALGSSVPLYRMNPSDVSIPGMMPIKHMDLPDFKYTSVAGNDTSASESSLVIPDLEKRKEILSGVLQNWLGRIDSMATPEVDISFRDNPESDDPIYQVLYLVETRNCLKMTKLSEKFEKQSIFSDIKGRAAIFIQDLLNDSRRWPE